MRAHCRIDLAHAALHHHGGQPFQQTLAEVHSGDGLNFLLGHGVLEGLHFHLHGADNA